MISQSLECWPFCRRITDPCSGCLFRLPQLQKLASFSLSNRQGKISNTEPSPSLQKAACVSTRWKRWRSRNSLDDPSLARWFVRYLGGLNENALDLFAPSGRGRLETDQLAARWVPEGQFPSVQAHRLVHHLSRRSRLGLSLGLRGVDRVANDWEPKVCQMDSNLVGAAACRTAFDQRLLA